MKQQTIFTTASFMVWLTLMMMLIPTMYSMTLSSSTILEWNLLSVSATPVSVILIADKISLSFSCVVLFISANVLSFSSIYMAHDKFTNRFTVLVLLFILSMNLLIFIPHLMVLLLGWDGLGLVSFILVMYYQNPSSMAASLLTALTNRLGDVAILLAIAMTLNQGHWLIVNMYPTTWLLPQVMLITCAAMTKSAQMPFSSWLPAAMAAPTPVSALVHSSTLVTAGVFLLIRFYPTLHMHPYFNNFMIIVATSTTFMAGLSANTECDFKKIVALSTLSQLGVMMFSLGLGMPTLAYFHMITHALFKALLFVCVGSFINFHNHAQDLRWMGNLSHQMPTIISCIMLANMALAGFPFLAGFYSKDMIMESMLSMNFNMCMTIITLISLGLTAFYSIRATLVAMMSHQMSLPYSMMSEPKNITKAVIMLSLSATMIGSTLMWSTPTLTSMSPFVPLTMKLMPLMLMLVGSLLAWAQTTALTNALSHLLKLPMINYASCLMWFMVPLSTQFTMKLPFFTTHHMMKEVDQGWLEESSGQGLNKFIVSNTNTLMFNTPASVNSYLLTSVLMIGMMVMFTNY